MRYCFLALLVVFSAACSTSPIDDLIDEVEDTIDQAEDLIDAAEGVPRKTIDVSRLGVNSFANDSRFGSISSQFNTVKNTLGLRRIRILFNWDDNVQPSPESSLNFSFYDDLAANIPAGVRALVVITGIPSWMSNSDNWIDGDPRKTFVESFVKPIVSRYSSNGRIIGFQIWNEPNQPRGENDILNLRSSPENYVEMLAMAHSAVKNINSNFMVLNASTTAISQNFSSTLDYNKAMRDAGVLSFVDIFAFHYYGRLFERFSAVKDFLNSLNTTLWVTESGIQGVNKQLEYGEQIWPYLRENIPNLDLIFIYQHTEATAPGSSFGLETLDPEQPVSDLRSHLVERAAG